MPPPPHTCFCGAVQLAWARSAGWGTTGRPPWGRRRGGSPCLGVSSPTICLLHRSMCSRRPAPTGWAAVWGSPWWGLQRVWVRPLGLSALMGDSCGWSMQGTLGSHMWPWSGGVTGLLCTDLGGVCASNLPLSSWPCAQF